MVVISGLDRDVNYYFVLTAYNMVGNESNYSNIVSVLNGTGKAIEWSIINSVRLEKREH
jgi:hypothetical protein